jgi:serine/threonine protein kinase
MSLILGKLKATASGDGDSQSTQADDAVAADVGSESVNWYLRETMPESASKKIQPDDNPNTKSTGIRSMSFTYAPGSKPLPPYTIRRGVGVGGFGEVYFAVSEAGKEVALKRIQRNLEVELRGVSHCLNLKHTNLVSLFDICHDAEDQAWVVMEYIAGPNLREVLDQSRSGLSEPEVRRWFSAIASGVQHLHSAGLVHRDLKPGNVFDDLGVVKVGDYGLSKFISASHRGGHTESVGTFHYMAPEIGRGKYGREIDIYALGIILYELLTGQVPFDGESCHEIIVKHLTASPDLSRVPQPYRSVIAQSLAKDPAQRPSTVTEMLAPLGLADASGLSADSRDTSADTSKSFGTGTSYSEPVARFGQVSAGNFQAASTVPAGLLSPSDPAMAATTSKRAEPFAWAIRESASDLHRWWRTLDQSPKVKKVIAAFVIVMLVINTSWLLPVLSVLGIFYVPYYIIRQMVLHVRQQPSYAQAQRIATAAGLPAKPATKVQWRSYMRTNLRAKRSIHRVAELSTSWIAATFTVLAMTIVAGVIGLRTGDVAPTDLAPFGWMAMVVLISALSILAMGKLWERDEGEALPRRLVMAGIGAGVGVAAYSVAEFLILPIDVGMDRDVKVMTLPQALYVDDHTPRASALMAHFALLFIAVRWWKPVDPLRRTRLSLWSVSVTVVTAWAVHQVLPIPQPYGMLIAGGIAIAVQMSAPWVDPKAAKRSQSQPVNQPPNFKRPNEYPTADPSSQATAGPSSQATAGPSSQATGEFIA